MRRFVLFAVLFAVLAFALSAASTTASRFPMTIETFDPSKCASKNLACWNSETDSAPAWFSKFDGIDELYPGYAIVNGRWTYGPPEDMIIEVVPWLFKIYPVPVDVWQARDRDSRACVMSVNASTSVLTITSCKGLQ